MLIASEVTSENPAISVLKEYHVSAATSQRFHRWLTDAKRKTTANGCTTSPTQRSENAKQRRNSLEGG